MVSFSPLIDDMIQALKCLPGVGDKTAHRMAFYLLERQKKRGLLLAAALKEALIQVKHCKRCRVLCEQEYCTFCTDEYRDNHTICVVETVIDLFSIEKSGIFKGRYFVLSGHLSPLDGIGPDELGIDQLLHILQQGNIKEIILATNPTVEGEATAYFLVDQIKPFNIKVSRLAHGLPVGGELEYTDNNTLTYAFEGRQPYEM